MKTIKLLMVLFFSATMSLSLNAQTTDDTPTDDAVVSNLTVQQRKMLQEQKRLIVSNRDEFRACLTEDQLAILGDATMTKEQKQQKLMQSLTEAQKLMLQEHRESVQQSKENFQASLTTEQRQQIKARMKSNMDAQDRKEMTENVKQRRLKGNNRN